VQVVDADGGPSPNAQVILRDNSSVIGTYVCYELGTTLVRRTFSGKSQHGLVIEVASVDGRAESLPLNVFTQTPVRLVLQKSQSWPDGGGMRSA